MKWGEGTKKNLRKKPAKMGGGTKKTIGGGTKKKLKARLPTAPLGLEIDIDIDYFFSQSGQDFSLK